MPWSPGRWDLLENKPCETVGRVWVPLSAKSLTLLNSGGPAPATSLDAPRAFRFKHADRLAQRFRVHAALADRLDCAIQFRLELSLPALTLPGGGLSRLPARRRRSALQYRSRSEPDWPVRA